MTLAADVPDNSYAIYTSCRTHLTRHAASGVTRGVRGERTAPGDTLQGVTPEGKNNFCGQIYKE